MRIIKMNHLIRLVEFAQKMISALHKHGVSYQTIWRLANTENEGDLEAIAGLIADYLKKRGV